MKVAMVAGAGRRQAITHRRGTGGLLAVLDIGTSKICCYVARRRADGTHSLVGQGYQLADGLRAGEIVDADAAEASIRAALHEAEQQVGDTVRQAIVIVGGGRPRSVHLNVERSLGGRAVNEETIERALRRAGTAVADPTRTVLHAVPIQASVDGGRPIRDPAGLAGDHLRLLVHLVVVDRQPLRNILSCLEHCHVELREVVAAPYAAALGTLTAEEMERGCLVIDMGAGATHVAHCAEGRLLFVDQIPEGGDGITAALAEELSTSLRNAERLKTLHGSVQLRACDDNVRLPVPLIGDSMDMPTGEVPLIRLTSTVRSGTEDILRKVARALRDGGDVLRARPPRSIVLTGGAAQTDGIDELAEEIFGLATRIGGPRGIRGPQGEEKDTGCSAVAGAFALSTHGDGGLGWRNSVQKGRVAGGIARLAQWMKQNF